MASSVLAVMTAGTSSLWVVQDILTWFQAHPHFALTVPTGEVYGTEKPGDSSSLSQRPLQSSVTSVD